MKTKVSMLSQKNAVFHDKKYGASSKNLKKIKQSGDTPLSAMMKVLT
jgi:hypothetical protein